jgi:hypothetical protein
VHGPGTRERAHLYLGLGARFFSGPLQKNFGNFSQSRTRSLCCISTSCVSYTQFQKPSTRWSYSLSCVLVACGKGNVLEMSSPLANLPSRGLLLGPKQQSSKSKSPGVRTIRRTPHAPQYFATNDTSPPKDQLILTDESNRLLSKFHALIKEKESKSNKRASDSTPGASAVSPSAPIGPMRDR